MTRGELVAPFVFGVALLVASSADAQVAPWNDEPDVVVLRDGLRLEGRVVDVRFGESTTLRAQDGSLRVIRWSEIERAAGPSFGTPRAPASNPVPPPPPVNATTDDANAHTNAPPLTESRPGTIPVVLISDGAPLTISSVLDARGGGGVHNESDFALEGPIGAFGTPVSLPSIDPALAVRTRTLCTTPCTLYLRPGSTAVHVGGQGRVESLETLAVRDRPARVTLRSVSSALFGSGVVMTLFGAALGVAGTFALVVDQSGTGTGPGGQSLVPIGVGCLIAGAVGLVIGIPILARTRPGIASVETAPSGLRRETTGPVAVVGPSWLGGGPGAALRVVF